MTFRWRKSHRMIVWQISKDYLAASSVNEERLKLRMSFTYVSTSKYSNNWYERHRHIDFDILTRIGTHTSHDHCHSWRRPEILTWTNHGSKLCNSLCHLCENGAQNFQLEIQFLYHWKITSLLIFSLDFLSVTYRWWMLIICTWYVNYKFKNSYSVEF